MLLSILSVISLAAAQFPSNPQTPIPTPSYTGCPPDGPLLPRPTSLLSSENIQSAASNLTTSLNAAVSGSIKAGWVVDNVTFSVAVVSPNTNQTGHKYGNANVVWEYHHRAATATQGTTNITSDSQYLIGSISKPITDILLLKSGLDIQRPVTDFLPELDIPNSSIAWREITLQMLGEHLAGIPPNDVYEIFTVQPLYEAFGFPLLSSGDYPSCGVMAMPNSSACTRQDLLHTLTTKQPVTTPNSRPIYSTLAFSIIALCLERATNTTYADLLRLHLTMPLNMPNTGVSPGNSSLAAIPPGMSSWGSDYGFNAPGGGLYSSINDLATILASTLDRTILPAAQTSKWLKPTSMTGSPFTLVGMPWEIQRTTHLIPAPYAPHTVDLYTKSGAAMGYTSQVALIDEYGVGIIVLTAGPAGAAEILYHSIAGSFIAALEEEARDQAQKYTGSWATVSSRPDAAQIRLNITMDHGLGLKLDSLTRGNASVLEGIRTIWETAYASMGFGILSQDLRLYPAGVEREVHLSEGRKIRQRLRKDTRQLKEDVAEEEDLVLQDWRVNMDIIPTDGGAMSDLPGQGGWSAFCASWQVVDWMQYGGYAVDRIVFVLEKKTGRVVGVEIPVLRGEMLTPVLEDV
ncbi:beta-lactamase/transpeptidase-like protein [Aspergillus ambiguus]|uniref:serine hydrolase domain-containing protein n=1 Tax=Aspergillus ambiguus TaxID=176160 RepID=UPI003CCCF17F